jgi:hypothetical protein
VLDQIEVRAISLVYEFLHQMGTIALNHKMCTRVHILHNWPNLVKYDFVDLRVSFPKRPRSPQSKFYDSRYGCFGGSHRVQIITRLNFVDKAPQTVLSPRFNDISPKCNLAT